VGDLTDVMLSGILVQITEPSVISDNLVTLVLAKKVYILSADPVIIRVLYF